MGFLRRAQDYCTIYHAVADAACDTESCIMLNYQLVRDVVFINIVIYPYTTCFTASNGLVTFNRIDSSEPDIIINLKQLQNDVFINDTPFYLT